MLDTAEGQLKTILPGGWGSSGLMCCYTLRLPSIAHSDHGPTVSAEEAEPAIPPELRAITQVSQVV